MEAAGQTRRPKPAGQGLVGGRKRANEEALSFSSIPSVIAAMIRDGNQSGAGAAQSRQAKTKHRGSETNCGRCGCVFTPERRNDDCGAIRETRNHLAVREYGPGEQLGGNFDALWRCRGWDSPDTFHLQAVWCLLETQPALQHDPNRPEDVLIVDADEDGIGGDNAADALRDLVATKARAVTQRKLRRL